ncbi:MAG TPA: type IV pilus assembly protein PilM [Fimbriimonadaceae bacterium]|jgi:type IV pilus assembly protein PilM
MTLSPFGKKSYVGIDLGHHTIKVVQVERSTAGWEIQRLAVAPTPADAIKESIVIDPASVGATIKQLMRDFHINATSCNIAVAGASVVVRSVRIPKMPEATLRKSIKYEASRYVPSSVEDSYIEFEIVGEADEAQMDVLIVAASREVLESRVKACEAAGLEVEAVDVEPFAAFRSIVEADHMHDWVDNTVAFVDLGATTTNMSVIHKGMFAMTRTIPFGSESLTEALKSYFKLSTEDAETGKTQLNLAELLEDADKDNPPLRVVQPHIDDLVRELRRSINYYQSQQTENADAKNVALIILSGGGAKMNGLAEYVGHKLGMEAKSIGVLENPRFTLSGLSESDRGLDIAVASGLAMRTYGKAA